MKPSSSFILPQLFFELRREQVEQFANERGLHAIRVAEC
jgi:hypothetical protein